MADIPRALLVNLWLLGIMLTPHVVRRPSTSPSATVQVGLRSGVP